MPSFLRRLDRGTLGAAAASAVLASWTSVGWANDAPPFSTASLSSLSLEELGNIDITSVSKKAEPLSDAPAAVYVITHDDIIRSGAMTIPEMLRLAPNLQVAQISAQSYAISARGFNSVDADKLLVLIDGRSVYTPLYGGVLWDEQDVLPQNVERIEVISGPGATLWGANAVNGVINIITRKSEDTQGGSLTLQLGNRDDRASLQYGGTLQPDLSYRVYVEGFSTRSDKLSTGENANDGWSKSQGGVRLDWTPANDRVTVEGDYYRGTEEVTRTLDTAISGGDLQATWQHRLADGSQLQLFGYYDGTNRSVGSTLGYSLNTYDLEAQHSFTLGERHDIVWGGGLRVYQDQFNAATGALAFVPARRVQSLSDIFAQDTIALTERLKLTVGMKLEDDPYSGWAPLPSGRLSWKADDGVLLWSAVSRAVRAPTRFDRDLLAVEVPGVLLLTGNHDFQSEKLTAYEVGTRVQPTSTTSFSVSGFYNVYDDLRSVEFVQSNGLPLITAWGNMMEGETYGVEIWGDYRPTPWWRLSAGFNVLHEALHFKAGASRLNNLGEAGNDPHHQASVRSSIDLGDDVTWDLDLRQIGALPNSPVPSYFELNAKIAWRVSQAVELSLSGLNLLHAHHLEYVQPGATIGAEVERTVYAGATWHF